ncbi:hypothetical protein ACJX0J_030686, partial [Zea mays]
LKVVFQSTAQTILLIFYEIEIGVMINVSFDGPVVVSTNNQLHHQHFYINLEKKLECMLENNNTLNCGSTRQQMDKLEVCEYVRDV